MALDILFTRFFSVNLWGVQRLSLQFLATALCAALLGPRWGMATAVLGDILGMLINSAGLAYFPGFTLTAALRGLVYGIGLHGRPLRLGRVLATEAVVSLGLNTLLNSLWLAIFFGRAYLGLLAVKLPIYLVWAPLAGYAVFFCLRRLAAVQKFGVKV